MDWLGSLGMTASGLCFLLAVIVLAVGLHLLAREPAQPGRKNEGPKKPWGLHLG
jgi:hypothetical protein